MTDLHTHTPSPAAKARAQRAGYDLDLLKREDPILYQILNAEPCVSTVPHLVTTVAGVIGQHFPTHQLFEVPATPSAPPQALRQLRIFPALDKQALEHLDHILSNLAQHPDYAEQGAYYRSVSDPQGTRRELALPLSPSDWQGEHSILVGPFAQEHNAQQWAQGPLRTQAPELLVDILSYRGLWYADLFRQLDHP